MRYDRVTQLAMELAREVVSSWQDKRLAMLDDGHPYDVVLAMNEPSYVTRARTFLEIVYTVYDDGN